jgi:hypothetical protein
MMTDVDMSQVSPASKCACSCLWHPWLQECVWILEIKAVMGILHADAYGFIFSVSDVVWIN